MKKNNATSEDDFFALAGIWENRDVEAEAKRESVAQKEMILCDTNILIELSKNNADILNTLKRIGSKNIASQNACLHFESEGF